MRNFCVVCVLLGVALFCQGFSVAPRTCRQPSCLQFGKLGGRVGVVETLAEVNEKNITEVSERLSKQMNEVEHRLSARIDAVSAETRADVPATREALSATEFSARTEAMRAEIKEGYDKLSSQIDDLKNTIILLYVFIPLYVFLATL